MWRAATCSAFISLILSLREDQGEGAPACGAQNNLFSFRAQHHWSATPTRRGCIFFWSAATCRRFESADKSAHSINIVAQAVSLRAFSIATVLHNERVILDSALARITVSPHRGLTSK